MASSMKVVGIARVLRLVGSVVVASFPIAGVARCRALRAGGGV